MYANACQGFVSVNICQSVYCFDASMFAHWGFPAPVFMCFTHCKGIIAPWETESWHFCGAENRVVVGQSWCVVEIPNFILCESTKSLFWNLNSERAEMMLNYFLSHQEESHACCLCFVKAAYIVKHLSRSQMPLHLQMPLSSEAYLTH